MFISLFPVFSFSGKLSTTAIITHMAQFSYHFGLQAHSSGVFEWCDVYVYTLFIDPALSISLRKTLLKEPMKTFKNYRIFQFKPKRSFKMKMLVYVTYKQLLQDTKD